MGGERGDIPGQAVVPEEIKLAQVGRDDELVSLVADQGSPQVLRIVHGTVRTGDQSITGTDVIEIQAKVVQGGCGVEPRPGIPGNLEVPDQGGGQIARSEGSKNIGCGLVAAVGAAESGIVIEPRRLDFPGAGQVIFPAVLLATGDHMIAVIDIQLAGPINIV